MKMEKGKRTKSNNVNKHIIKIMKNYFSFVTKKELFFDLVIPAIISLLLVTLFTAFEQSIVSLVNMIISFNGISLTVIAILAGFNTSSLAIIISTNKESIGLLAKAKESKGNVLVQVITFFSFAVLLQMAVLIVGVLLIIISNTLLGLEGLSMNYAFWIVGLILVSLIFFAWLTAVLYCLFISIRNVSLLYNYILYIGEKSKQTEQEKTKNVKSIKDY